LALINQNPLMRARVMPVFTFDPNAPAERPIGLGTVFRVDPFGNCATAFHVVEHMLEVHGNGARVRSNVQITALEIEGILFGRPALPEGAWRPLSGLYAEIGCEISPLVHEKPRVRNLTELACLHYTRSKGNPTPYLPVALRHSSPAVGSLVTAMGFADLDSENVDDDPISQYLHEIPGMIIEVIPSDGSSSRPWPKIRVAGHWPSGMSGGPVLNERGHVIGVVSTSFDGADESCANLFAGWNIPERIFPTLDPDNSGRFIGYAAINKKDDVCRFDLDQATVVAFAAQYGHLVYKVSFNPETSEWIKIS
jgi:serine protease Do